MGTKFAQVMLIGLMALGSVLLWVANPLFWLWLGSRIQEHQGAGFGPYLLVLGGIAVTMAVVGKGLGSLNRVYGELTGVTPTVRVQMPWHRSMRGERDEDARPPRSVLDVVMVISVSVALLVFGIWFFLFAGSSLPT
jgi:hypothetical protein